MTAPLVALGASLALALALVPVVRAIAPRVGLVAAPKADRWHARATPMGGGIAIAAAAFGGALASGVWSSSILAASLIAAAVGLLDDIRRLSPLPKLLGILAATAPIAWRLTSAGCSLGVTGSEPLDLAIAVLWLAGASNALNLVDNMDGLAAGTSAIAAASLGAIFILERDLYTAPLAACIGGASLGFLAFNRKPASIFMGDCGSLFLGISLAALALSIASAGTDMAARYAPPLLALGLPLFDTALVSILRLRAGRSPSAGGRDHSSHRLVARGMTEREAVRLLWIVQAGCGAGAVAARVCGGLVAVAIASAIGAALLAFGVFLARGPTLDKAPAA